MKEVHKMYIESIQEELNAVSKELDKICKLIENEAEGNPFQYENRFRFLIGRKEGLQFALDKAKGILPL